MLQSDYTIPHAQKNEHTPMNTENDFLSSILLSIRFCHFIRHSADWSEQKTKVSYTFWCIQEGSFTLEINAKSFTVSAGDTVLFYPGCRYKAYAGNQECSFLFIGFSLQTDSSADLLSGRNYCGIYRNSEIANASRAFYLHSAECLASHSVISFRQYSAFMGFLAVIAPFFGQQEPFFQTLPKPADTRIHRLIDYIHEFYLEPLTNAELAAYIGMSEKYFIRFFRAQIGTSPMQYLQNYRMQQALALLADPSNSLSEIAQQLHFTDQFSFSKAFKRYYGESPSIFRRQLVW